jgi:hypothetical protein
MSSQHLRQNEGVRRSEGEYEKGGIVFKKVKAK